MINCLFKVTFQAINPIRPLVDFLLACSLIQIRYGITTTTAAAIAVATIIIKVNEIALVRYYYIDAFIKE